MIVERKRIYSSSGDKFEPIYEPVLNEDGTIDLVVTGERDLQEYIQSFAEDCTLENILRRYELGDQTALSKAQGFYADTTEMPKTFRDVLDSVIKGQSMFDQLPLEVKQKFNNDFNQWFVDIGSEDWCAAMGLEKVPESVPEVKKEEGAGNGES